MSKTKPKTKKPLTAQEKRIRTAKIIQGVANLGEQIATGDVSTAVSTSDDRDTDTPSNTGANEGSHQDIKPEPVVNRSKEQNTVDMKDYTA